MTPKRIYFLIFCISFAFIWAGEPAVETDYLAVMLEGKKIGFAVHSRQILDGRVKTTEKLQMTLGRGGQTVQINSSETHIETLDGQPLGFEMVLTTSGIEQKHTGTIENDTLCMTVQMMGQTQTVQTVWPTGALLSEGLRQLQMQKGLKEGTTYQTLVYRPDMQAALAADVQVGKTAPIDLFGRIVPLTEVKVKLNVPGQPIEVTSFVNADGKALKTLAPMMGMTLELIQCDQAFAARSDDVVDFLDRLSVKSPADLSALPAGAAIRYELVPTCGQPLAIPNTSSQRVSAENGRLIVIVSPATVSGNQKRPYDGDDPVALAALAPTAYLQADNPKIKDLAAAAVGDTANALKAARQIESFVKGYITTKDLSVGYASAAEVAVSRQGDCSEHAVLTAAMCRAAGIPARVVCGVVYVEQFASQKSVFGGHMWVEAFIDGQWIGLDATRAPEGVGAAHIALAVGDGNPSDFFSLVQLLGCFKIEKAVPTDKK